MIVNLIVVDDFYDEVNSVRKFALEQPFERYGNYPGKRTENFLGDVLKNRIQSIIEPYAGKVTDWNEDVSYTGSFQLTTSNDKSWVHSDTIGNWGGVLFLTPDAPLSAGTAFYKSKLDGSLGYHDYFKWKYYSKDNPGVRNDITKWEKINEVGNVYNRLMLFRSYQWHCALDYFGQDNETGRLTQVFFLRTEK